MIHLKRMLVGFIVGGIIITVLFELLIGIVTLLSFVPSITPHTTKIGLIIFLLLMISGFFQAIYELGEAVLRK